MEILLDIRGRRFGNHPTDFTGYFVNYFGIQHGFSKVSGIVYQNNATHDRTIKVQYILLILINILKDMRFCSHPRSKFLFFMLQIFGMSVACLCLLDFSIFCPLKGCNMRKSILLAALLGAGFVTPGMALAEEAAAAPAAAAEPASPHTVAYNIGLFSQYVWRGMTQTDESLALQGGVDYAHSSGFYAGAWASNVSWTTDFDYMDSNSLELDLYGGYASTFGETGIGYNVGVLQYIYPGTGNAGAPDTDATEVYGALSYKWANAKYSYTVSDEAWGFDDAEGTYYLEANADIPIGESGYTINLHVGKFDFDGQGSVDVDYVDWKAGVTKAWANGVKLGAYYTDNDADSEGWADEFRDSQFTVFVQKVF